MAIRKIDETTVEADVEDVFPTPALKAAYDEALASLEAGRYVANMREKAGLTQAELAKRLGISQARVSAIENGEGRDGPSYALLKRITAACGGDLIFVSSARGARAVSSPVVLDKAKMHGEAHPRDRPRKTASKIRDQAKESSD